MAVTWRLYHSSTDRIAGEKRWRGRGATRADKRATSDSLTPRGGAAGATMSDDVVRRRSSRGRARLTRAFMSTVGKSATNVTFDWSGRLKMKRLAVSDVKNASSSSDGLPSRSQILRSCHAQQTRCARYPQKRDMIAQRVVAVSCHSSSSRLGAVVVVVAVGCDDFSLSLALVIDRERAREAASASFGAAAVGCFVPEGGAVGRRRRRGGAAAARLT